MYSYKGFDFPRDLSLLCSVFFLLIYYSLLLKLLPLERILNTDIPNRPAPDSKAGLSGSNKLILDKIYRASNFFLQHVWHTRRPCLKRALVLRRWCLAREMECGIVIGVNKSRDTLKSHAWLEIDAVPFREAPGIINTYTPIIGD